MNKMDFIVKVTECKYINTINAKRFQESCNHRKINIDICTSTFISCKVMDIHVLRSLNRRCRDFRIHFQSTKLQTRTQLFLSRTNRTTPASFCRNRGRKRYRYLQSCRWIRIDGARLGVLLPVDGEDAAAKVSL